MSTVRWAGDPFFSQEDPGPRGESIAPLSYAHSFSVSVLSSRFLFCASFPFSTQIQRLLRDVDVHCLSSPLLLAGTGLRTMASFPGPHSAATALLACRTDISSILFHFRPAALVLVEALGCDLGGRQARPDGACHGLLQGVLERAALPGTEVAVGDLVLRVVAAGVPWAKRVRFRVSKINMGEGEAEILLMAVQLYAGQEPPHYGSQLVGCAPTVCALAVHWLAVRQGAAGRSPKWRLIWDARVPRDRQGVERMAPAWADVNGSESLQGDWGRPQHHWSPPTTQISFLGQALDTVRLLEGSDQPVATIRQGRTASPAMPDGVVQAVFVTVELPLGIGADSRPVRRSQGNVVGAPRRHPGGVSEETVAPQQSSESSANPIAVRMEQRDTEARWPWDQPFPPPSRYDYGEAWSDDLFEMRFGYAVPTYWRNRDVFALRCNWHDGSTIIPAVDSQDWDGPVPLADYRLRIQNWRLTEGQRVFSLVMGRAPASGDSQLYHVHPSCYTMWTRDEFIGADRDERDRIFQWHVDLDGVEVIVDGGRYEDRRNGWHVYSEECPPLVADERDAAPPTVFHPDFPGWGRGALGASSRPGPTQWFIPLVLCPGRELCAGALAEGYECRHGPLKQHAPVELRLTEHAGGRGASRATAAAPVVGAGATTWPRDASGGHRVTQRRGPGGA
jgi:hypothetical protein